jgi:hypothetical protein
MTIRYFWETMHRLDLDESLNSFSVVLRRLYCGLGHGGRGATALPLLALFWWSGQVQRTEPFRQVEDAKSCAERVSDYRIFPDSNLERRDEYVASFCCIVSYGSNDIID